MSRPKPLPPAAPKGPHIFSAQFTLKPHGKSIDFLWPDGRLCFVLVHDEILKFPGLLAYLEQTRGERRAKLTIQGYEKPPLTIGGARHESTVAETTEPPSPPVREEANLATLAAE